MWLHPFLADIISVITTYFRGIFEYFGNNYSRKKAPKIVKFELNLNRFCLPFTIIIME